MSYLFYECSSLKSLPDISKWDIINVKNINYLFYGCSSLKELPDISKWNTNKINKLNSIFENCSLLTFIPNISKWEFHNKIEINYIFKGCNSLLIIPDISKWNASDPEFFNDSAFNSISISIKEIKSDSIISENIMENSDLYEDLSSLEDNNDENKGFINNENLGDYYDNFYN